jgi:hypothetical protein
MTLQSVKKVTAKMAVSFREDVILVSIIRKMTKAIKLTESKISRTKRQFLHYLKRFLNFPEIRDAT